MRSHAYRDPLLGARARLEQRKLDAKSGEARLSPSLLSRLPGELVTQLAELRAACNAAVSEELDGVARAEGLFSVYCAALEDTLAKEPDVDAAYRAMPDTVADPPPRARTKIGLFWSAQDVVELEEVLDQLAADLARIDPRVRFLRRGKGLSRVARFRAHDAPFSLRVELRSTDRPFCFDLTLATSVPRALPRLVLRPEGFVEALFRSFGVRHTEVGDLAFDGLFVIDGPAAKRLLTPGVRATLQELAYFDIPRLVVEGGVATLSFSFDPVPACIGAAMRALVRLRNFPV